MRQSRVRAVRNAAAKSKLKKAIKTSRKVIVDKKADDAKAEVLKTIKLLDKAASKGIIKKNTAARNKSRLMKRLNSLGK